MPKVILNGQTFTSSDSQIGGLEAVTVTIRRDDGTGVAAFSFTGELTFYGDAFEIIREQILLSPTPHLVKVPIILYADECPEQPFLGYVEGSNVDWCELDTDGNKCSAKAQVIDGSADAEKLACVKNTIIWAKKEKFGTSTLSAGKTRREKAATLPTATKLDPAHWQSS